MEQTEGMPKFRAYLLSVSASSLLAREARQKFLGAAMCPLELGVGCLCRSLMLVRNVGPLMTNPAILDRDGNETYEGLMDDFRLYDRKLDAAEILDVATSVAIPEPCSVLLAPLGLLGLACGVRRRRKRA